jgi:hypothetical protein
MYGLWCAPMETQDSCENQVCLLNHFVSINFGIQTHNCLMLWKAIVIGPSRSCAKSTSLGYSSNYCGYLWSYGSTMCVQSKLKLLATFRCPCCGNFTCMLNANKLFDTWFHEDPSLWWWSSSLLTTHAKISYTSSRTFPFIHALFSILQKCTIC